MPEGSALERTAQAAREIAAAVRTEPEVTDYQIYAGVAVAVQLQRPRAPLLHAPRRERRRHPGQPRCQRRAQGAEPRHRQARPPARRGDRREITARASPWPKCRPARPCCKRSSRKSTARTKTAGSRSPRKVRDIFKNTPGVVDMDWYVEADQPKARFVIDKEKAALHGISAETISQTLRIAVGGESVDLLHVPREKEDVNIVLQLPRASRDDAGGTARAARALRRRQRAARARRRRRPRRSCRCANWCTIEQHHDRQEHLSQEPDAGDLRHRRRGRRRRKPGLCDSEDEQGAREARHARVRRRRRGAARSTTPPSPSPTRARA